VVRAPLFQFRNIEAVIRKSRSSLFGKIDLLAVELRVRAHHSQAAAFEKAAQISPTGSLAILRRPAFHEDVELPGHVEGAEFEILQHSIETTVADQPNANIPMVVEVAVANRVDPTGRKVDADAKALDVHTLVGDATGGGVDTTETDAPEILRIAVDAHIAEGDIAAVGQDHAISTQRPKGGVFHSARGLGIGFQVPLVAPNLQSSMARRRGVAVELEGNVANIQSLSSLGTHLVTEVRS